MIQAHLCFLSNLSTVFELSLRWAMKNNFAVCGHVTDGKTQFLPSVSSH